MRCNLSGLIGTKSMLFRDWLPAFIELSVQPSCRGVAWCTMAIGMVCLRLDACGCWHSCQGSRDETRETGKFRQTTLNVGVRGNDNWNDDERWGEVNMCVSNWGRHLTLRTWFWFLKTQRPQLLCCADENFVYMCSVHMSAFVFIWSCGEEGLFLSLSAFILQGDPWLSHQQTLCLCVSACVCVCPRVVCPHQD